MAILKVQAVVNDHKKCKICSPFHAKKRKLANKPSQLALPPYKRSAGSNERNKYNLSRKICKNIASSKLTSASIRKVFSVEPNLATTIIRRRSLLSKRTKSKCNASAFRRRSETLPNYDEACANSRRLRGVASNCAAPTEKFSCDVVPRRSFRSR